MHARGAGSELKLRRRDCLGRWFGWFAAGSWRGEDGRVNNAERHVVQVDGRALIPVSHAGLWIVHKRDDFLWHAVGLGDVSPRCNVAALHRCVDAKLVQHNRFRVHALGDLGVEVRICRNRKRVELLVVWDWMVRARLGGSVDLVLHVRLVERDQLILVASLGSTVCLLPAKQRGKRVGTERGEEGAGRGRKGREGGRGRYINIKGNEGATLV